MQLKTLYVNNYQAMKSFKFTQSVICLLIFSTSFCNASLEKKISNLIASDSKKTLYGVCIFDVTNNRTLYKKNHSTALIPASNMKLVTSAAALKYLGCDFKYETQIGLCGKTLAIVGSGDPLLGDEKTNAKNDQPRYWPLNDIADQLIKNDIKNIDGIITDTTIFDDIRVNPSWPREQLNQWYACEVSGLNFNSNCIDIEVRNSKGRAIYILEPKTKYLNITNKVKTVGRGNSAVGAYRSTEENKITLKGKVRKSAKFDIAIERPAGFFAYLLAEDLINNDIAIAGQITEGSLPKDCKFKKIISYQTPISDVLLRCNRDSLGLAAEALLKTMSAKANGNHSGSWQGGSDLIANYLTSLGISNSEFIIDDGSGLSRKNRLSPRALVAVMTDVYKDSHKRKMIMDSLSIGGVRGTAAKWFKDKKYKGKIFVKTGYINGVRSYTGVCKTSQGDILYSIITNKSNGKSRKTMNSILKAVVDQYDK